MTRIFFVWFPSVVVAWLASVGAGSHAFFLTVLFAFVGAVAWFEFFPEALVRAIALVTTETECGQVE